MMQNQRQEPLAGPSKYTHHQTDSTISSSHITAGAPPTPVSPHPRPAHVQAIHDFDPSLLASTSSATSNPNMYLSFTAGEIIRVHVRDATGWWDGEISAARYDEEREKKGPRRGWFPSNYVREMGWDGVRLALLLCIALLSSANVESSPSTSAVHQSPSRNRLLVPGLEINPFLSLTLVKLLLHPMSLTRRPLRLLVQRHPKGSV